MRDIEWGCIYKFEFEYVKKDIYFKKYLCYMWIFFYGEGKIKI